MGGRWLKYNYKLVSGEIKNSRKVIMRKVQHVLSIMIIGLLFTFSVRGQDTTKAELPSITTSVEKSSEKNDSNNVLNDLLIPIWTFITLLSLSVGIWISVRQYRLKVKEEIRLSKTAQSENDIKLLSLFSETIEIANGRKGHVISGNILEKLFEKDIISNNDFNDLENLKVLMKKLDVAARPLPVGLASQISAIVSIGVLGKKYEVLHEPAIKGLISLIQQGIKEPTQDVLNELNIPAIKLSKWKRMRQWW